MTMSVAHARPRGARIALWAVKILLAAVFLAAGGAKLAGVPMLVQNFEDIGFGQWFRYLTGALEVGGGIAILIPAFSPFAAALLACVMIGAIATHIFLIGGSSVPAIILLLFCMLVVFAGRGAFSRIAGR
jgi:putative oxidoreductase